MRDAYAELSGDQCGRYGGVDIAIDKHPIRRLAPEDGFNRQHDTGRDLRLRATVDIQEVIRLRHLQGIEEHSRHVRIKMLSGMNQQLLYPGPRFKCPKHWRRFHKIGPCTHYVKYFHNANSCSDTSKISAAAIGLSPPDCSACKNASIAA